MSYILWISHAMAILLKTVQNYHPSVSLGKDGQMWLSAHREEKKEEKKRLRKLEQVISETILHIIFFNSPVSVLG